MKKINSKYYIVFYILLSILFCFFVFNMDNTTKNKLSGKTYKPTIIFKQEDIIKNPIAVMLIPAMENSLTITFTDSSLIVNNENIPITYTKVGYVVNGKNIFVNLEGENITLKDSAGNEPFNNDDIIVKFKEVKHE